MSSASEHICCSECQDFVSDERDTHIQLSRERGKFVSNTKGLRICLRKILHRREMPNSNILNSYEKSTLESIRKWETPKGKRALLCGVTYNNQKYKIKGTNYDVIKMKELLISKFRFPSSSIHILAGILILLPKSVSFIFIIEVEINGSVQDMFYL